MVASLKRDEPTRQLAGVLQRLAPDLAAELWRVRDVREVPYEHRGAIIDVLGHECATRDFGRVHAGPRVPAQYPHTPKHPRSGKDFSRRT